LTIGKNSAIVSIKAIINNWFRYFLENVLLTGSIWEDMIKIKAMIIFGVG